MSLGGIEVGDRNRSGTTRNITNRFLEGQRPTATIEVLEINQERDPVCFSSLGGPGHLKKREKKKQIKLVYLEGGRSEYFWDRLNGLSAPGVGRRCPAAWEKLVEGNRVVD